MKPTMILHHFHVLLAVSALLAIGSSEAANSLVWDKTNDVVSADVRGMALWPLLEDIAHQTGWHIFVEPGLEQHKANVKFADVQRGEALKKLLGDFSYALVPQSEGPDQLYVFATKTKTVMSASSLLCFT